MCDDVFGTETVSKPLSKCASENLLGDGGPLHMGMAP